MGCGNVVTKGLEIGGDILAAATGNAELIPLINAGVTTAGGVARGESIGKAAGQGLISGGEALAGQEIAGAFGIGSGNDAFNSALGITGDNPAGTGLPDIGGAFNNVFGSGSGTPSATTPVGENSAGAGVNSEGTTVTAPTTSTSIHPSSGGGFASAGKAIDLGDATIDAQAGGYDLNGVQTSTSPNLGSLTGNAGAASNASIGAASTSPIGATTDPFVGGQSSIPASLPSTAAATPSSSGLGAFLPSKADVGKSVLSSALPVGALAFDAIKGPAKLPSSATALGATGAATAPLLNLENQNATEAATGQLTESQQANIMQGVQQQQNELLQQLANSGSTDPTHDSRFISGMQQIQQWALAQQQNYITQSVNAAVSAGGAASQNIASVANMQLQGDNEFQDALAKAFGALGGTVTQKAA